jgi:putative oxidoreductase
VPVRIDVGLLVLRLTGLSLALVHGWPKLVALQAGTSKFPESVAALGFPAPTVFAWLAALAEVVGGLGVALGLGTRIAAGLAAFTMVVAAFLRHHAHDLLLAKLGLVTMTEEQRQAWGNPEMALVYLAAMIAVALVGPGRLSIDAMMTSSRGRKK